MSTWYYRTRYIGGRPAGALVYDVYDNVIAIIPRQTLTGKGQFATQRHAANICLAHNAEVWDREIRGLLSDYAQRLQLQKVFVI